MSTVHSRVSENGSHVTIHVEGRFDFSLHKAFREAYQPHTGANVRFDVDLSRTEYLDSSSLGMLLLLRDHAGGDTARVRLCNPSAEVEKILRIANFGELFEISGSCAGSSDVTD